MSIPEYVYQIVINAPRERVWQALTSAEFTEQYWHQTRVQSTFEAGARVAFLVGPDDAVGCEGEVLTARHPEELSYTWRFPRHPEVCDETPSRVTFLLEAIGEAPGVTRLTIRHDRFPEDSKMRDMVKDGWPLVLGGLKTLLETERAVDFSAMA